MARPRVDEQRKWESKINHAIGVREDWSKAFFVEKGRQYFEGDQYEGNNRQEWIVINKIYSHLEAQLPSLYSVDPYFYVKLARSFDPDPKMIEEYERMGKVRQGMLNYLKNELNLKQKARLCIQDAHFAYGVIKVHFTSEQIKNPLEGTPVLSDDGIPLMDEEDGSEIVWPEYLPANQRYHLTRIHPDDIIFGCDSGPTEDKWDWIAERVCMSKDEAKKNPHIITSRLPETPSDKHGINDRNKSRDASSEREDDDDDDYIMWEVYDIKRERWFCLCEGAEKPVMNPTELPAGVEKHPYCVLRFTLRDRSPYPIPPISQGIRPQYEYNSARSKVMTHRKRFNRKYEVFTPGLVDEDDELSKLESGDDGTIIRKQVAQQIVFPISDAPLDQQTYTEILALNNDLVEVLGGSDNMRGIARSDSATEAALIDKRLEVREGDRLSLVIDWVQEIARKLDHLVQANITSDEAVRVVGPDGERIEMIRAADYQQINGDYEYSINAGATIPRLPQIERSQFMAFLQVVGNFPQLLMSRSLLKRVFELFHIEDEILVEEMLNIGQKMMGQQPGPGGAPGQAAPASGIPTNNPITAALGQAFGDMGGNANGGGFPPMGGM